MTDPVINFKIGEDLIPILQKHADRVNLLRDTEYQEYDLNYFSELIHPPSDILRKCIQFLDLGNSESDKTHYNMSKLSRLDKKYDDIFNNSNDFLIDMVHVSEFIGIDALTNLLTLKISNIIINNPTVLLKTLFPTVTVKYLS